MALIFLQTLTCRTSFSEERPPKNAFHCWTVCFGSGVADGVVVLLCCCCCFSFLLPFSEMAEAAANDVSSFFLS